MESLSADAKAILESMGDAFYALDGEWRFIYANRRALEFWEEDLVDGATQGAASDPGRVP